MANVEVLISVMVLATLREREIAIKTAAFLVSESPKRTTTRHACLVSRQLPR